MKWSINGYIVWLTQPFRLAKACIKVAYCPNSEPNPLKRIWKALLQSRQIQALLSFLKSLKRSSNENQLPQLSTKRGHSDKREHSLKFEFNSSKYSITHNEAADPRGQEILSSREVSVRRAVEESTARPRIGDWVGIDAWTDRRGWTWADRFDCWF